MKTKLNAEIAAVQNAIENCGARGLPFVSGLRAVLLRLTNIRKSQRKARKKMAYMWAAAKAARAGK